MDIEGYINLELEPKPCYDNPPGNANPEEAERYPIIAENSYDNPRYTSEDYHCDTDTESRCDIPNEAPNHPFLGHLYSLSVCFAEVVGIVCVIVTGCWIVIFRGGFSLNTRKKEFNGHPIFMVIGLVFFYANAAITSHVLRQRETTTCLRAFHFLSIFATFITTGIGFATGIEVKRSFYSLHSWLGLISLFLFTCQFVIGFIGLFPKCKEKTRKKYLKFQVWVFLCVFILNVVCCITGISNYLRLENVPSIKSFSSEGLVTNILHVVLLLFGILVCSILSHPIYRKAN